jgi:N-acetylmuramoyl-L-alanine amidase
MSAVPASNASGGREDRGGRRRVGIAVAIATLLLLVGVSALGFRQTAGVKRRASNAQGSPSGDPIGPDAFATGACRAFEPTSGDRHETVFLDAGHGGIDPGGVGVAQSGTTIFEADETLPVELDAMALLRAKGFRVVVSRTGDSTVLRLGPSDVSDGVLTLQGAHDDVAARDVCANDAKASVMVGIYFDAGGSPQNAGSLTAYDAERPFSAANLRLADLLQEDELSAMNARGWGIPDDGVLPDTNLGSFVGDPSAGGIAGEAAAYDHLLLIGPAMAGYFSTPSQMPGAVIEPLYITDPFEGTIAASAQDHTVMARGIATAVEQYLALPATGSTR